MNDPTETRFINVDLDLLAQHELTELVQAFEPDALALNCMAVEDGNFANLELAIQPTDAEAAIRRFVDLIHRLPTHVRELWDHASKRDLSIGVEAGATPSSFEFALTPGALALAAEVGARIVVVVYVHTPASPTSSALTATRRRASRKAVSSALRPGHLARRMNSAPSGDRWFSRLRCVPRRALGGPCFFSHAVLFRKRWQDCVDGALRPGSGGLAGQQDSYACPAAPFLGARSATRR